MHNQPSIDRPCIKKCSLNDEDVCLGCFRTFEDMKAWRHATRLEKETILLLAQKRKIAIKTNK